MRGIGNLQATRGGVVDVGDATTMIGRFAFPSRALAYIQCLRLFLCQRLVLFFKLGGSH